jgi:hypothetical protein
MNPPPPKKKFLIVNGDISLKLKPLTNNLTSPVVAEVEVLNVKHSRISFFVLTEVAKRIRLLSRELLPIIMYRCSRTSINVSSLYLYNCNAIMIGLVMMISGDEESRHILKSCDRRQQLTCVIFNL